MMHTSPNKFCSPIKTFVGNVATSHTGSPRASPSAFLRVSSPFANNSSPSKRNLIPNENTVQSYQRVNRCAVARAQGSEDGEWSTEPVLPQEQRISSSLGRSVSTDLKAPEVGTLSGTEAHQPGQTTSIKSMNVTRGSSQFASNTKTASSDTVVNEFAEKAVVHARSLMVSLFSTLQQSVAADKHMDVSSSPFKRLFLDKNSLIPFPPMVSRIYIQQDASCDDLDQQFRWDTPQQELMDGLSETGSALKAQTSLYIILEQLAEGKHSSCSWLLDSKPYKQLLALADSHNSDTGGLALDVLTLLFQKQGTRQLSVNLTEDQIRDTAGVLTKIGVYRCEMEYDARKHRPWDADSDTDEDGRMTYRDPSELLASSGQVDFPCTSVAFPARDAFATDDMRIRFCTALLWFAQSSPAAAKKVMNNMFGIIYKGLTQPSFAVQKACLLTLSRVVKLGSSADNLLRMMTSHCQPVPDLMRLMHVIPTSTPTRSGSHTRTSSRTHKSPSPGVNHAQQGVPSLQSQSYADDHAIMYGTAVNQAGGVAGVGYISPADATLVRHTAANLLLDMALLPDAAAHFAAKDYVKPLVQLMEATHDSSTRMYALLILARLANHSAHVQMDAVREGAVPILAAMMCGGNAQEALHACRLAAILAQSAPCHQELSRPEMMTALLGLIRGQQPCSRPDVVEHACSVLAVMADNPDTHFQMVSRGVIPILISLLPEPRPLLDLLHHEDGFTERWQQQQEATQPVDSIEYPEVNITAEDAAAEQQRLMRFVEEYKAKQGMQQGENHQGSLSAQHALHTPESEIDWVARQHMESLFDHLERPAVDESSASIVNNVVDSEARPKLAETLQEAHVTSGSCQNMENSKHATSSPQAADCNARSSTGSDMLEGSLDTSLSETGDEDPPSPAPRNESTTKTDYNSKGAARKLAFDASNQRDDDAAFNAAASKIDQAIHHNRLNVVTQLNETFRSSSNEDGDCSKAQETQPQSNKELIAKKLDLLFLSSHATHHAAHASLSSRPGDHDDLQALRVVTDRTHVCVLTTLQLFAVHESRHADAICRAGVLPRLVTLLLSDHASASTKYHAASVISTLCCTEPLQEEVVAVGGLDALSHFLTQPRQGDVHAHHTQHTQHIRTMVSNELGSVAKTWDRKASQQVQVQGPQDAEQVSHKPIISPSPTTATGLKSDSQTALQSGREEVAPTQRDSRWSDSVVVKADQPHTQRSMPFIDNNNNARTCHQPSSNRSLGSGDELLCVRTDRAVNTTSYHVGSGCGGVQAGEDDMDAARAVAADALVQIALSTAHSATVKMFWSMRLVPWLLHHVAHGSDELKHWGTRLLTCICGRDGDITMLAAHSNAVDVLSGVLRHEQPTTTTTSMMMSGDLRLAQVSAAWLLARLCTCPQLTSDCSAAIFGRVNEAGHWVRQLGPYTPPSDCHIHPAIANPDNIHDGPQRGAQMDGHRQGVGRDAGDAARHAASSGDSVVGLPCGLALDVQVIRPLVHLFAAGQRSADKGAGGAVHVLMDGDTHATSPRSRVRAMVQSLLDQEEAKKEQAAMPMNGMFTRRQRPQYVEPLDSNGHAAAVAALLAIGGVGKEARQQVQAELLLQEVWFNTRLHLPGLFADR